MMKTLAMFTSCVAITGAVMRAGAQSTIASESVSAQRICIGDAWEWLRFGNLTTAGIGTDKDKDGESDAAESNADTNPNDPGEYLRIDFHDYSADLTRISLRSSTTRPTRLYRIEGSTTLKSTGPGAWADIGLGVFAPDSGPCFCERCRREPPPIFSASSP